MTHEPSDQPSGQRLRSITEPDRPSDIDRMDDQLRNDIQPEQDIQPEEGTLCSSSEKQIRGRSKSGTERIEQNTGDDVGEVTEEA